MRWEVESETDRALLFIFIFLFLVLVGRKETTASRSGQADYIASMRISFGMVHVVTEQERENEA